VPKQMLLVADNVINTYNYPIYCLPYINLPQFSQWKCPDPIFRWVCRASAKNLVWGRDYLSTYVKPHMLRDADTKLN